MPNAMVPWGLDTAWGDDVQQASEIETHHTDILSETLASSCRFTYLSFGFFPADTEALRGYGSLCAFWYRIHCLHV
jgi:hypothetical protein